MKSFIEYPFEFEKMLFPGDFGKPNSGKLIAHYELYKKVRYLKGSIVKCGVASEEGFTRFALLRSLINSKLNQKTIAFEKFTKSLYLTNNKEDVGKLQYQVQKSSIDERSTQQILIDKGITDKVEFIPGDVERSIPEFLIENPEFKIAYLNIDFDDYDSTLTALQFFYPRLVQDGILILDNYYKKEEDFTASKDYFKFSNSAILNFSVNNGPHYLVRF